MEKSIGEDLPGLQRGAEHNLTRNPDRSDTWRTTKKAMKILTAILLAGALHVSATGTAQQINFSGTNVPLTKVFNAIEDQLGYGVLMPHQLLAESRPVTVDLKDGTLGDLLEKCFSFQPWKLAYSVTGKTIFIFQEKPAIIEPRPTADPPVKIKVTGEVYDEKSVPLAGANVTIVELQKGTITNGRGEFELPGVSVGSTLNISFVGYAPQQVKVTEPITMKIYLKAAKNELDKVVVQAYGTTTQRLTTGNISTVRAEEIAKQPVMNVLEALQGQVPGVIVTNAGSYATSAVKVEIRGRNTINPNFPSDPLYIIDGVPLTIQELTSNSSYANGSQGVIQNQFLPSPANGQSPFFSLDPSDIESIEVLKDADATAIYGSRGSNGVIIITTKKGKAGKTSLNLNVSQGINENPRYYDMLNTRQYVAMREEALNNDGLPVDVNYAPDLTLWDTTRYTNWQKAMWGGLGKETNAHATLSGGDNRTTFRLGAGYLHETDILNYSGANQRGTLDFNLNHKSQNQRLVVGLTGSYGISSTDQIYTPSAINLPPNAPAIFDSKGNPNFYGWTPLNSLFTFGSYLQPYTAKTNFLNSNLLISFEAIKGLTIRTSLGYNNITTTQTSLIPLASQDPANARVGTSSIGVTFIHNVIVEPQIEYTTYFGKGKFDGLLGVTSQVNSTSADYMSGSGYTDDALLSVLNVAPIETIINSGSTGKYASIFGRVNYNFEGKYILNLNARRDGSSKFGPGRQYGNFGSVGAAWIFSEEDWVRNNIPLLSFGKVRGSYGIVGGDQISNYEYLSLWQFQRAIYNGSFPLVPTGHTDSLLQWQVNRKLEGAIDLGFLKDRITLEVAFYRNRTNNQLVSFPTPEFSGFSSVTANSPANVQNEGIEFSANAKILDGKRLKWSARFTLGLNSNKLLAYPNLSQSPYASTLVIGKSLAIRRVLHYTGIDPQTGGYSFEDINHDGQISYDFSGKTSDDSYVIDMAPKFDGGVSTNVSLGNLELSIFFYFKRQLGSSAYASLDAPGDETNQPVAVLNHWRKPGDITVIPKFTTQPPPSFNPDYQAISDAGISDASFIRLQNVQIAYNVPANARKKAGLGQMKLFVQGKNLFIISHYNGLDPETQNFGSMPLPRTVVAGISWDF